MNTHVICTIKDWHINIFNERKNKGFKGWNLITSPEQLTYNKLVTINPRYIFFPHWSWVVPEEIINNFECVCFHSSDVPYGRGGSPIQNLIIRNHKETKISALKMVKKLDAGPVYCKSPLSLRGRAQDIYQDSAKIISDMMLWIALNEPNPIEQVGKATIFKRRAEADNILPLEGGVEVLYNHIRMLDADSYPKSYIEHGEFHLEFSHAAFQEGSVEARVTIRKKM